MRRRLHSRATSALKIGLTTNRAPAAMNSAAVGASRTDPHAEAGGAVEFGAPRKRLEHAQRTRPPVGELHGHGSPFHQGARHAAGNLLVAVIEQRHQPAGQHRAVPLQAIVHRSGPVAGGAAGAAGRRHPGHAEVARRVVEADVPDDAAEVRVVGRQHPALNVLAEQAAQQAAEVVVARIGEKTARVGDHADKRR